MSNCSHGLMTKNELQFEIVVWEKNIDKVRLLVVDMR